MNWDSFWKSFGSFFETDVWSNLVAIVSIIAVAFVLRFVLHIVIGRVVQQIVSGVKRTQKVEDTQALFASPLAAVRVVQRTRTLGSVLTNIVNVIIFVVSVLLIINTLSTTVLSSFALLTAAIGAGLGFGAQNIVKDALNGLFMVMEDQLGVGDIVDLGPATGVVEGVGVRITQVRDVNGTLWFVRNGEILRVGNMSHGWARVIIDLAIPYDADVDAVQAEMLRVAIELASSSKWRSRVLEKPEIWGLESISAEALVIRLVVKTRTSAKDDVARELRMRLKKAVDDMGIVLPSLNSIVLTGFDGAASVQGARPPRTAPVGVVEAPAKATRKTRNLAPRIRAPKNAAASTPASPAAAPKVAAPKVAAPKGAQPTSAAPQSGELQSTGPNAPASPKDTGGKSAAAKEADVLEAEAQVTERDASNVK